MKKIIALLIATMMLFSLAACGESIPNKPSQNGGAQGDGKMETALFTLDYDDAVWFSDEECFSNEDDFCKCILEIPSGEDEYLVNVEIWASVEDAEDFREYITDYGFDQYEYAEKNSYELVNVGGVDCLYHEGSYWGEDAIRYFGRVENASLTVFVEAIGDVNDSRVGELISAISFRVEDIGNTDFPWAWKGTPFSSDGGAEAVGAYSLSSTFLPMSEPLVTNETFDHAVAAVGSDVYILSDGILRVYTLGDGLTLQKEIVLDGEYNNIQATKDGSLWVSEFMEPMLKIRDGQTVASFDDTEHVTMHPDGTWGIDWFSGPDCRKVTISGNSHSFTDISFPQVSTIFNLFVDESNIYVCGSAADESGHKVFIYDFNYNLEMTLCDEDGEGLGSITAIAHTENGFLGMDGNMRDVILWSHDGSFIGQFDGDDLFDTYYPWFCSGTMLSDGRILVIMTEDREDQSAMELVAFVLSDF